MYIHIYIHIYRYISICICISIYIYICHTFGSITNCDPTFLLAYIFPTVRRGKIFLRTLELANISCRGAGNNETRSLLLLSFYFSHYVYHPISRQIHWSTLCAWYVQRSQEFHTLVQYMCNKNVGVPKSWLHWANVLYPAPCHLLQPRIAEFWSVLVSTNLKI